MARPNTPSQIPITAEVLQTTVSKIGIKIPEHLVQDYVATLADAQRDMETLMAMDGELQFILRGSGDHVIPL
jgi:hypothetical protein